MIGSKTMQWAFVVLTCLSFNSLASDQSIDFAAQAKQESAKRALATVSELSKEIQQLKANVVDLNKDLRLMEEELLFPSSTQASVFVSVDSGEFFSLESVKLKLDGKVIATHLYSDKQRQALARGGVQRLHMTNLNNGLHTLAAFFTGLGPNGRPYKRATQLQFTKGKGSQYIELAVVDDYAKQEPVFTIKQW
ncbi:MAG: AraC family transcriptional regulator [Bermanella sp.]